MKRTRAASNGRLLLAALAVSVLGTSAATAASHTPSAATKYTKQTGTGTLAVINDGLPKTWVGVTRWNMGYGGKPPSGRALDTTVAKVTLTLAKKTAYTNKDRSANIGKGGTVYTYLPTGKITVVGWCGYKGFPVTVALLRGDGQLSIWVPTDKRLRPVYVGSDFQVLTSRQPRTCADGTTSSGPTISSWGFKTEFGYGQANAQGKKYRHTISASAPMISGTYVMNDTLGTYQPLDKFRWCFVRDGRGLGKCR